MADLSDSDKIGHAEITSTRSGSTVERAVSLLGVVANVVRWPVDLASDPRFPEESAVNSGC